MTTAFIVIYILGMPLTCAHVKGFDGWRNSFMDYFMLLAWPLWAVLVAIVLLFKLDK